MSGDFTGTEASSYTIQPALMKAPHCVSFFNTGMCFAPASVHLYRVGGSR